MMATHAEEAVTTHGRDGWAIFIHAPGSTNDLANVWDFFCVEGAKKYCPTLTRVFDFHIATGSVEAMYRCNCGGGAK